jgi:hypothetical protein
LLACIAKLLNRPIQEIPGQPDDPTPEQDPSVVAESEAGIGR